MEACFAALSARSNAVPLKTIPATARKRASRTGAAILTPNFLMTLLVLQ
jgi:hypothetical protein